MCHFFVVCLYLYYCSRHPVFKRRELVSHYQITSRHVYVAFSYLYCCFIVCSYLYYCCVHPIFRIRELCSYQQIKSRHVCVSFFLLIVHVCIALLTFNISNSATFACVTFLLFVHICIAVVVIQFSREEDHYPFHRLNPATYVSLFSDLYY